MTLNEYQNYQMRTAPAGMNDTEMLINASLGLCGESGEVADIIKKCCFQGHELDKDKFIEELGDVCWYLSLAAKAVGCDLDEVARKNVEKLLKRYPQGFDSERSVHREAYGV